MEKWHEELGEGSNFLSTKIGEVVTITVTEIKKVTEKPDFDPKTKAGGTQGFHFEFIGEEGIVTASTYALQNALKEADVAVGDTITITHPGSGVYNVEKK